MQNHDDEILTDNTKIEKCRQCKDCFNWGHSGNFGNAPDKACCDMYRYPDHKPIDVIENELTCPYYRKRE